MTDLILSYTKPEEKDGSGHLLPIRESGTKAEIYEIYGGKLLLEWK